MKNKKFADRYIVENYDRLEERFRRECLKINERGDSSLDKLNDTMLSLYMHHRAFRTYEEFRFWAEQKFGERTIKKTRKCRTKIRNTGS